MCVCVYVCGCVSVYVCVCVGVGGVGGSGGGSSWGQWGKLPCTNLGEIQHKPNGVAWKQIG